MAIIYDLDGKKKGEVQLPRVFEAEYRPDLIKRAVLSARSARIQAHSTDWMAGKRTTALNKGTGYGMARVRRVKAGTKRSGRKGRPWSPKFRSFPAAGVGAFAPQTVGGRRVHGPLVETILIEQINKKERKKAVQSAIAATANKELVLERGHKAGKIESFPIVIEDKLEELKKAKEVEAFLGKIGLSEEMERTQERKIRAGRGKMRGRKYRTKTGPLIVIAEDKGIGKAASNLAGVDVSSVNALNAEKLSPGAHGARLTIWTESAIRKVGA